MLMEWIQSELVWWACMHMLTVRLAFAVLLKFCTTMLQCNWNISLPFDNFQEKKKKVYISIIFGNSILFKCDLN